MPRGGSRPGAGRKPGGQRAKPPGPIEIARAEVRKVLANAQSPLAVLCEIAADPNRDPMLRVQAATAACPFLYPRLSAAVVANVGDKVDRPSAQALIDRLSASFARLAPPEPEPLQIEATAEPEPAGMIEAELPRNT